MARKTIKRKPIKARTPARATRPKPQRRASAGRTSRTRATTAAADTLLAAIPDTEHHDVGGVKIDVGRAGDARVKRVVYPVGFRWSVRMKPITGTDRCMHAHVGFLARGRIHMEYADGCVVEYQAPQVVAIEPGHDGWVVGRQPAVLIEVDFEKDTVSRLGMPDSHRH